MGTLARQRGRKGKTNQQDSNPRLVRVTSLGGSRFAEGSLGGEMFLGRSLRF